MNNSNIRRIDELGRIVIPKSIRKKLNIKENDQLEIYIEDELINIKKYSTVDNINHYLEALEDICNRITGNNYIITDREKIVAATEKSIIGENINQKINEYLFNDKTIENELVFKNININNFNYEPIMLDSLKSGIIIEYNYNNKINNKNIIRLLSLIIEKYLNNG